MKPERFEARCEFDRPLEEVFRWHERAGAFDRLNPPWDPVEVQERYGGIRNGARVTLRVPVGPFSLSWTLEHRDFEELRQFKDVQLCGPFQSYAHTHSFESLGASRSALMDKIEYRFPCHALSRFFAAGFVKQKLERLFRYRHHITQLDLVAHARYQQMRRLTVLVSGASGLVGSALIPYLTNAGHSVKKLVRGTAAAASDEIVWDPNTRVQFPSLTGIDAVVHLAGEPIADGRWTESRKKRIKESRVRGTTTLCEALLSLTPRPKTLICASAIGYYGSRGDEVLNEDSSLGTGFLADVSHEWEQASEIARAAGIRVVNLRLGVVLSPRGGALKKMLPAFSCGLGGKLGSGSQWMSWIAIDDVLSLIEHALCTEGVHGPLNAVAPAAVTNAEFTSALAGILRRPSAFSVPAWVLRLAAGELANEALLSSARVVPTKATESGYLFRLPKLQAALRHMLGR